ncbi:Virus attachment protein p12 family, partial [Dysosmobacter welbionis]
DFTDECRVLAAGALHAHPPVRRAATERRPSMKAKELLVSAGSLLLAGLILVVAGNAVAPAAAAN